MRIGVDFDNTTVCYDHAFYQAAVEKKLIPADLAANKDSVRGYLRSEGVEERWTELQGVVYGSRMELASCWPGVKEFFRQCVQSGIPVFIVSHKTRYPYQGQKHDLHEAAWKWLTTQGFFDDSEVGLERDNVFFELSLQEKLARIDALGCTHFIDDLPEVLGEEDFPPGTQPILFDPASNNAHITAFDRRASWSSIAESLLGEK